MFWHCNPEFSLTLRLFRKWELLIRNNPYFIPYYKTLGGRGRGEENKWVLLCLNAGCASRGSVFCSHPQKEGKGGTSRHVDLPNIFFFFFLIQRSSIYPNGPFQFTSFFSSPSILGILVGLLCISYFTLLLHLPHKLVMLHHQQKELCKMSIGCSVLCMGKALYCRI